MRQLIAIFFLCVLSSQVLPLKQVGKILFKSQITEEIGHHTSETGSDDALKLFTSHQSFCPNPARRIELLSAVMTKYIHISESIPDQHASEIFAPPPNGFSTIS